MSPTAKTEGPDRSRETRASGASPRFGQSACGQSLFTPRVRDWFQGAFAAPTPAQEQAWPAIATGEHVLISAPTGSGKTLAAFLWGLDRLTAEPSPRGE